MRRLQRGRVMLEAHNLHEYTLARHLSLLRAQAGSRTAHWPIRDCGFHFECACDKFDWRAASCCMLSRCQPAAVAAIWAQLLQF